MSKKRKFSSIVTPMIKVEVKEENIYGDDILSARGRLKGVLQDLADHSEEESGSSDEESRKHRYRSPRKRELSTDSNRYYGKGKRRRSYSSPPATAFHHTYVMKLFDRSVDLARFEEDTPLYPICRAWMANQPRNAQVIVKRRVSTPDDNFETTSGLGHFLQQVYRLPAPEGEPCGRVPPPLPEQRHQNKDDINLNYDENPPVSKDELIQNHLQRWARVKQNWITQANKNDERFKRSFQILTTIYNKAQESML